MLCTITKAHCGIALTNDCMTLSVGCRAPSVSDLVSRLAENMSSSLEDDAVRRYTDEDLLTRAHVERFSNGELTKEAKLQARQLVIESFTNMLLDDKWWDEFFGRYATEQKRVRMNYPIPLDDEVTEFSEKSIIQSVLNGEAVLYQAEGIAFAYSCLSSKDQNSTIYRLFANGEMWQSEVLQTDDARDSMPCLFEAIANHRRLDKQLLLDCFSDNVESVQKGKELLEELVKFGLLYDSEN